MRIKYYILAIPPRHKLGGNGSLVELARRLHRLTSVHFDLFLHPPERDAVASLLDIPVEQRHSLNELVFPDGNAEQEPSSREGGPLSRHGLEVGKVIATEVAGLVVMNTSAVVINVAVVVPICHVKFVLLGLISTNPETIPGIQNLRIADQVIVTKGNNGQETVQLVPFDPNAPLGAGIQQLVFPELFRLEPRSLAIQA